jgi:membrane protein DedA with SNARE-associated domain
MEPLGLLAIVGLLFVKESGLPVPVPGDLVVIGAGVAAATGLVDPVVGLAAIVAATVAGGACQFLLVRGAARRPLLRLLGRLGLAESRIDALAGRLRGRGATGVAVARATPGVRVVAVAASALAGLPFLPFLAGLGVGNGVFVGAHFGLGFLVGEPALRLASGLVGPLAIAAVGLGLVGGIGWWLLSRRRAGRAEAEATPGGNAAVLAWTDACCPACLALAAIRR